MGKTLQKLRVERNGWVKGILLVWALGLLTFLTGLQAQAQASLPLSYDGPWASVNPATGMSQSGLGADYLSDLGGATNGNSAKFDSPGDYFLIELTPGSTPGTLTYYLNPRNTFGVFGGEFVVEQAGTDGIFSPLETFTSNLSAVGGGTLFTNNPNSTSRYIRFRYVDNRSTTHFIQLDKINLVAATGPEINVKAGAGSIGTGKTYGFGSHNLNSTSNPVTFTIENTGIADLTLTSTPAVAITGTDAALFTVDQTTTANVVGAGSSTTFTVSFHAATGGTKSAQLTIANDDANEGAYVINLTATAADLPPTVSALTPTAGKAGDEVVITGNNLFNVTSVTFAGNVAASYTITNNSEIRATVPAGASTGAIVVATATNSTSSGVFTVYPTPAITAIAPTFGGEGMTVTLTGSGFTPEATIDFNGTPVITKNFVNTTSYEVTVPAGATTGPITITTNGGTASSETFTVYPKPTITGIDPTEGAIGATVTLTGTDFTPEATIDFNGTAVVTKNFVNATTYTVTVPAGATTGPINLSTNGGTASSATFTVFPQPAISAINPTFGGEGMTVTLTGSGFTPEATIDFNGTPVVTKNFVSATSYEVTVPAGATTGPINLTTNGGTASSEIFTVYPTPAITGINPTFGGEGMTVTLTGTDFTPEATIDFNGTPVVTKNFVSATSYEVTVPAGATTGPITITTNGGTASSEIFTVYPKPTITGINPTEGAIGATVTLTGSGFTPEATIDFNGTAVVTKNFVNATTYTVTVPAGATTGPINLTTNGGSASSATFTVFPQPTISAINPTFGGEGMTVTLTGSGFTPEATIDFNGTPVVTKNFVNALSYTVIVPAGATTGPITITTNGGTASSEIFTVYPKPTITGINPTEGATGATVTITGTDFTPEATIDFNGTPVVTKNFVSATSYEVTVPAGAITGPINLTTNGGSASSETFTVYPTPTITGINPTFGGEGMTVTLTGSGFTPEATIDFNGTAVVTKNFVSATSYEVTVPAGATTGPINLTTNGGTASSEIFTVYPKPTISGINPTEGAIGSQVTITGTNFTPEATINFNGTPVVTKNLTGTTFYTVTVPAGATTGPINLTTNGGTASSESFTVFQQPSITGINPTEGAVGVIVTLAGTNFTPEATIDFNGTPVVTKNFVSATSYEVTVPAGATTGPIHLTTNGGTASSATFTVFPQPTISAINPTFGAEGTEVTLTGSGFTPEAAIDFNGTPVVTKTFVNASTYTVIVPVGATTGPINLTTNGGMASSATFTVFPQPTISAFDPTSGFAGDIITITGTNFTENSVVYFNGLEALSVWNSETELQAMVPETAMDGPLSVRTEGGTAIGPNFDVLHPAPTITAINPTQGAIGTTVTITGTNFLSDATIAFNGTPAAIKTYVNATTFTAVVPEGATTGPITLTTDGGEASSATFTVFQRPTITNIDPTFGGEGMTVTLTGTEFTPEATIDFNGTAVVTKNFVSATSYEVTVPAGATTGPINLTTNGGTASSETFTVYPKPTITNIDPVFGGEGMTVTLTGSGFTPEATIDFNGTAVVTKTFVNATTYTVTVPIGATTGPINLTTNGGTASSATFTVYPEPTITAFDPTSGFADDIITITGTNFTENSVVYFNGLEALSVWNSETELQAMVPEAAIDGPISVRTEGGTAIGPNFDVRHPAPTITGINPTEGAIGTTVTITGTNFFADATIAFNGTPAVTKTYVNATTFTAVVPEGATTGPITLTTDGGEASSATFTVFQRPTITNIDPTAGAIASQVTITGTNFTPEATIDFNGTAVVTKNFVDATSYIVTVPAGATTGPISITTNGGTASSAIFTVYPQPGIISFNPTSGHAGDIITITGNEFSGDAIAYFNGVAAVTTVNSTTEIQAVVPATATDGPLSVQTLGGTAVGGNFDVIPPAPTITSFTPAAGPIGTEVTIAGTNFTDDAIITFNGEPVITKNRVSDIQYTVIVPQGATDGNITLSVEGQTATSEEVFTVSATGVYTWNVGAGSWSDPNSWNPARTTPGAADELIFDGNVVANATATLDFGTQTIGQLKFTNGVAATFTMAEDQTLTIDGGVSGTDLALATGTSLNITNATADAELHLTLSGGETGVVSGAITMQGAGTAAHYILAVSPASLTFMGGSTFTTDTNFSGNPFSTVHPGAIHFLNGSTYNNRAGDSPFGAANAVVVFEPTSTYNHQQNSAPDLANRLYGNFVIDAPGFNQSVGGSGNLNVTNLTMANGDAFNLNLVGQISINGNIDVTNASSTLAFNPASSSAFNIVGSGTKALTGAGAFTLGSNATLNVNTGNTLALQNTIEGNGTVAIFGTVTVANTNGLIGPAATNPAIVDAVMLSTAPGSTVIYNGAGAQSISPVIYANLVIADRGAGTVTLPTGTLQISEVFTPASGVSYATAGSIVDFIGTELQAIPVFNYDGLTISGGAKSLDGNINVTGDLTMAGGQVLTGANRIILGTSAAILNESNTSYIDGWVQALARPVAQGDTETFGNIGLSLNPANSGGLGNISVLRQSGDAAAVAASQDSPVNQPSVKRVFDITGPESGVDVTMTFAYLPRELNGNVPESMHLYKQHPNELWEEQTASAYSYGTNSVTYSGVTGFSKWTLAMPNVVLPVELTAFTAKRVNDAVELKWTTAMERNNQGFDVEVSTDAQYYQKVGFVASKNPNARTTTAYSFTDDKTLSSGTRYYRLKQVDLDGKVTYFGPKTVFVESMETTVKVFPNPFNDLFTVKYVAETSHTVTLTLMDGVGKKVHEQLVPVTRGIHYLPVQVGNHRPKGVYLLHISGAQGTQTFKMLKK